MNCRSTYELVHLVEKNDRSLEGDCTDNMRSESKINILNPDSNPDSNTDSNLDPKPDPKQIRKMEPYIQAKIRHF